MDIEAYDEVEAARLRGPGRKIALDPFDTFSDLVAHGIGRRPAMSQCGHGEVDGGDPPSARRQPERLRTMATARIEGISRSMIRDLGGQMKIRGTMRHHIGMVAQDL